VGGSCIETFRRVKDYVVHVHMHDLHTGFPYIELFEELVKLNYSGYLSAEIGATEDPTRVMTLHNIAIKALVEIARRNVVMHG
jgi:sugar phosphate isomerase/epimerase